MTITELNKKYNTKLKCLSYLEKLRWGKAVICTKCGSDNVVKLKKQAGRFHCNACNNTFSVISDTIFEESKLPLSKWFHLISLMLNAKKGISAKELLIKHHGIVP